MNSKRSIIGLLRIAVFVFAPGVGLCQPLPRVPAANGAQIDERLVRHVVVVSPSRGPFFRLENGFQAAHALLVKGIATRIVIESGIYREAVVGLDWREGKAADTPLIVEGKGDVTWTGADIFPSKQWTQDDHGLWRHPWPYRFGNFAYSWSAKGLIGHRSELAFVNGHPLRPRILERYEVTGIIQGPEKVGKVAYRYLGIADPKKVLQPGEFGIMERPEDKPQIFLRPAAGEAVGPTSIEVSVRRNLLDLRGKNKVVLRNISFTRVANDDDNFGANNAIRFSIEDPLRSEHVLIDHCHVLWCAQTGLHIDGDHWTIRDSDFSYNGGSGMASGRSNDILWERNRTNFNVWRLWQAGELGYYTGGFKMHETTRHTIRGHESIGNCTMGAWWDIHCHDVRVSDLVAIGNAANLQFELCEGPFVADRLLLAGGRAGDGQLRMWEHGATSVQHSILYSNYRGGGTTGLYNIRWFGRTDRHAKISKITAGVNLASDNVFVGGPNVPNFGLIDDIRGAEWSASEPMSYRGTDNVFWNPTIPNFASRWIKDSYRTGELAARAISVADWMTPRTYSETGARDFDPRLRDPDNDDYRFATDSPLYPFRNDYPQVALSSDLRGKWDWFIRWSGYQPNVWNTPPAE